MTDKKKKDKKDKSTYESNTGYSTSRDYWFSEEGIFLVSCWARDGWYQQDIADRIGISRKTLRTWKNENEDFKMAIERGKELVDYEVENALYKRAVGCTTTERKVYFSGKPNKKGNLEIRKIEETTKEVLPDVTAALAWLNNRKPNEWKRNRDNFVDINEDDKNVTINVVRVNESGEVESTVEDYGYDESEEMTDEEWEALMEDDEPSTKSSSNKKKSKG